MTVYNDMISAYITDLYAHEDEALAFIRRDSLENGLPDISVDAEEGQFLHLLVSASQAKLALEIGTLGGYSGTWIARALAPGGRLITLEKSDKHAAIASEHFARSGVADKVTIMTGDAHQLLPGLEKLGLFDFVFIDADKVSYPDYFDWAVKHVRLGGIICLHNALWGGAVVSPHQGEAVDLVKAFNRQAAEDPGVTSSIYPAGDGTLVAVRVR
jgi:caffeoyl-CoA O-methyltransferase